MITTFTRIVSGPMCNGKKCFLWSIIPKYIIFLLKKFKNFFLIKICFSHNFCSIKARKMANHILLRFLMSTNPMLRFLISVLCYFSFSHGYPATHGYPWLPGYLATIGLPGYLGSRLPKVAAHRLPLGSQKRGYPATGSRK